MSEKNKIEQPETEYQKLLVDIMSAEPSEVTFLGKKKKISWLYNETIDRFTSVSMKENNERKRNIKLCVLILLNDRWKFLFKYWWYWRYLYYFRNISDVDILGVIDACKKKIPSTASSLITILATEMTNVMMNMTQKEANAFQAEQRGERGSH